MRLINKNQGGFTLIELLVAVAITGLITSGLAMTISQLFSGNAQSSNHMTAVRQVQNAGYWVSRDAKMAQSMVATGVSGFPLTLTWTEWNGTEHEVIYNLNLTNGELSREYYTNSVLDATTLVAQYIDIDPSSTNYGLSGGSAFSLPDGNMGDEDSFTITDPVGGDFGTISITTAGDVVKLTPVGGATVDGGFSEKTLNISNSPMSWATPVAGSSIIVTATSNSSGIIGSWISLSGTATAIVTTDSDGDATFDGNSNSVLIFTVTATVGSFRSASETRVYEVSPRPNL